MGLKRKFGKILVLILPFFFLPLRANAAMPTYPNSLSTSVVVPRFWLTVIMKNVCHEIR